MTRMTATDEDATKLTTAITKISTEATVQTNASLTLLTLTGIVVIVNNFTTNNSDFTGYPSNTESRTYKLRLLTHLIHIGKKR